MAAKLSTRLLCWFSICTLVGFLVFSSLYTCIDLKHVRYVKTEQRPRNQQLHISNTSFAQNLTHQGGTRDIFASKIPSDDALDYELSFFTDDKEDEGVDKVEEASNSAKDGKVENDNVSVLDIKHLNGSSSDDVSSLNLTSSSRYYDPELYIDLYRSQTTNKDGSVKIINPPPIIFIMAQWRFGSSVFGELFNQNSDLFFLFEPLYPTEQMMGKGKGNKKYNPESQQMCRDVLRKLSRCRFDEDWVKPLNAWGGKIYNKAICGSASFETCTLISPAWMSEICRKYKGRIAAKMIRANLETLKPLIVDDRINLKIIHLVRDPRGSVMSRINYVKRSEQPLSMRLRLQSPKLGRLKQLGLLSTSDTTDRSVKAMCKWIRENAIISPDLIPDWLKDRYYLVRYEDFADSPLKVTKELYKFAGIPFPQEVQQWVLQNTHASKSRSGTFSTDKNSHVAATHWINDLTKIEVDQVEAECSDVLKLMGYEPYSKLIHYNNIRP